jgi:acyl carrier protein
VTVTEKIRKFIIDQIGWDAPPTQLTDDYALISNQVIDSLGIYKMVTFLENEFAIEVEDEELVSSNFGTISAIADLVASKRG